MEHTLQDILKKHKQGQSIGIYSICSSHPFVLEAAMLQAQKDNSVLLIESTSNQVDQFGGYTGMTPLDFVNYVKEICAHKQFPFERVILGGDHLGPNVWQDQPSTKAMPLALDQIKAYANAGYTKIHLDTSMRCADDPGEPGSALSTEIIAERAAQLCAQAESVVNDKSVKPVYIIGTEVPIPGGAQEELHELKPTSTDDLKKTIDITKRAFYAENLHDAWERVIAVVVQPGVEFGDATVVEYNREKAAELSLFINNYSSLIFEAHSTDYQPQHKLQQLVKDHFAILKVGPGLTFALREALFALANIEDELCSMKKGCQPSHLQEVVERQMLHNPKYWAKHYHGDDADLALARKYSYSDRIRYYWPMPAIDDAVQTLIKNLSSFDIPLTLLSQYMPEQYWAVRQGTIHPIAQDLIHHKIGAVVQMYASASGF